MKSWTLFIDGASRGNPGPSGAGAQLRLEEIVVAEDSLYLGRKTNNQAEYAAMLLGVWRLKESCRGEDLSQIHITITSDSELLVKQMRGQYRIKNPGIVELSAVAKAELEGIPHSFKHVLRHKNKDADRLANKAVDERTKPAPSFTQFLTPHHITLP